ncbi:hypothetical protein K461DRAFT_37812 [Myriangium duriaei CBS 260.36]|uniref:Uncharacterized protein n=1 Tax=Myriangium duriaei CBS 260.36 TaxID=1168546 RepID=A0A9P4MHG9_9PEZI|nr:hypothetical protein K461DRAFT_37812 [Myriangium duriaei CBS 260.36]
MISRTTAQIRRVVCGSLFASLLTLGHASPGGTLPAVVDSKGFALAIGYGIQADKWASATVTTTTTAAPPPLSIHFDELDIAPNEARLLEIEDLARRAFATTTAPSPLDLPTITAHPTILLGPPGAQTPAVYTTDSAGEPVYVIAGSSTILVDDVTSDSLQPGILTISTRPGGRPPLSEASTTRATESSATSSALTLSVASPTTSTGSQNPTGTGKSSPPTSSSVTLSSTSSVAAAAAHTQAGGVLVALAGMAHLLV